MQKCFYHRVLKYCLQFWVVCTAPHFPLLVLEIGLPKLKCLCKERRWQTRWQMKEVRLTRSSVAIFFFFFFFFSPTSPTSASGLSSTAQQKIALYFYAITWLHNWFIQNLLTIIHIWHELFPTWFWTYLLLTSKQVSYKFWAWHMSTSSFNWQTISLWSCFSEALIQRQW